MSWFNDHKRVEQPRRVPPVRTREPQIPLPVPARPQAPITPSATIDPLQEIGSVAAPIQKPAPVTQPAAAAEPSAPSSLRPIPYSENPRWCKPRPGAPAQWARVDVYRKAFLFPGMKHEIRPRKPGDLGEYRDAIPGECFVLYDNSEIARTGQQNAGVFIDDTTEDLFRRWFDFET